MLHNAVRQKIEERFGRPIRYSKDCEALAASIGRACQERISPTTLKRLFGFAKTVDQPRLFTLDLLAQYIGYPNWQSLLQQVEGAPQSQEGTQSTTYARHGQSLGVYRLNHQISIAQATQTIDLGKINALATELGHLPAFIPFITELIGVAARQQRADFLGQVFSMPRLFEPGVHGDYELYYIGQAMGLTLRQTTSLTDALIPALAANVHARRYLVEWFVDEDFLTGYYGKLLDAYHEYQHQDPADRLFYFALKYKQCMLLGDVIGRIGWYRQIKTITFSQPLYQILAARYVGTCLAEEREHIFQASSPYYSIILQYIQGIDYEVSINFVFFLSRELYLHQRFDWLVQLLADFERLQVPAVQLQKTHLTLNLENQLQVYIAFAAYLLGDYKKAKEQIMQVDTNMFDPFIYQQMLLDYQSVKKAAGLS